MQTISVDKLDKFKKMVDAAENIGIASHVNPDGDNLGSSLALRRSLENYGKDVDLVGWDSVDNYLKWLPDLKYYSKDYKDSYDLFIVLDSSDPIRIGSAIDIMEKSNKTIAVDHHIDGTIPGDLKIIDHTAPATCQLVYEILTRLGFPIDETTATLLFSGLVTDTGRFMLYNTNADTFRIAADLIDRGADKDFVYYNLYQNKPLNIFEFENELYNTAQIVDGNKYFAVASDELVNKYSVQIADSEYVANTLRDVSGIELAMLVKEYGPEEFKVSLRSKNIDVSEIARANGGGGHENAAGFTIYTDGGIEDATNRAFEILKNVNA